VISLQRVVRMDLRLVKSHRQQLIERLGGRRSLLTWDSQAQGPRPRGPLRVITPLPVDPVRGNSGPPCNSLSPRVPVDRGHVTLAQPAAPNESGQNQERTGYRKHQRP
jgi:hypothetical protein